jgi:hypothetical protein
MCYSACGRISFQTGLGGKESPCCLVREIFSQGTAGIEVQVLVGECGSVPESA